MINITVTKKELADIADSEFTETSGETRDKLLLDLKSLIWSALLTPFDEISMKDGLPLPVIYAYTEVKRAIGKMHKTGKETVSLENDVFKTAYNYFQSFQGWNSRAAAVIILMDQKLQKLHKEHFPNG